MTMTTVRFPQVPPPVCTQNKTVAFLAVVDGRTTMMEIWAEALRDHFEAASSSPCELLEAFRRHRAAIEAMARKKLQDQPAAGWRLLTSADFAFRYDVKQELKSTLP